MQSAIHTRALTKTYQSSVHALRGIDLDVPAGCCFGLLGPNGAGKSTLVKVLLSIVRPTSGQAELLGRSIGRAEARRKVGYLPEGHRFPSYLTAAGVCRYFGALGGQRGPALERDVEAKLELVGLGEWRDVKVKEFSKGMAQRVGVAQSLMGDPDIVFLDEPTDGVDPVARQGLRFVIRQATERGATVFINSHLLSEIEVLCDRVAIMDKGQILRSGTVAELTSAASGQGLHVRVRSGPLAEPTWKRLAERGAKREPDGWFLIMVPDESHISGLIDELRADQVAIFAVEPRRMELEDAFIQIIGADRGLTVSRENRA